MAIMPLLLAAAGALAVVDELPRRQKKLAAAAGWL